MTDLSSLSPAARSAAMRGGVDGWGQWGSSTKHIRYMEPKPATARRHCQCGCRRRATHYGCANGVTLISGCELRIRRWVKTGQA